MLRMEDFGKSVLLFLAMCASTLELSGQQSNSNVSNVRFWMQEGEMVINYDLPANKQDEYYQVIVKIIDSVSHRIIYPKSFTGDLRPALRGGSGKKIEWYYLRDSVKLSQRYNVIINTELIIIHGGPANALRSAILPGWGDYYVYNQKGNPAFILSIAAYGCIGYGIYNLVQSDKSYNAYKQATEQNNIDKFYNKALKEQNTFKTFTAIGIGIWAADIANVLIAGAINTSRKNKLYVNADFSVQNLNFYINPTGKYPGAGLTLNF